MIASIAPSAAPAETPRYTVGYQHWLGGLYVGRGLRFNNPYRLRRVLGDDPSSLSLGATYLDLHVGRGSRVDAVLLGHGMGFESFERARGVVLVHGLEHDVVFELLTDVGLELERGHLQEADSLLQLRGHRQRLTQLQLQ